MYYYDTATKECNEFNHGGCDGNANQFDSYEDCEAKCKKWGVSFHPLITNWSLKLLTTGFEHKYVLLLSNYFAIKLLKIIFSKHPFYEKGTE